MKESGGQRRWMRIQAGSTLVESGCPPVGSDPQRPRRWSRQNAVRGGCSPEPQTLQRARGVRELRGGGAGVMSADYRTERRTSFRRNRAWRPALPGIPPNSRNPKIPKIPKAKLQAGLQKFGDGLPGFPAPALHSGHHRRRQGRAPLGGDRCAPPPSASPGHLPRLFTRKGPRPRAAAPVPGRWSAGLLPRLGSAPDPPPHTPPVPSYRKGKLGPCENPEECSL